MAITTLHIQSVALRSYDTKSSLSRVMGRSVMIFGRSSIMISTLFAYLAFASLLLVARFLSSIAAAHLQASPTNSTTQFHPLSAPIFYPALIAATLASLFFYAGAMSDQSIPSIRLWLVCCEVVGLSQDEVASVCHSKPLVEMHRRLGGYLGSFLLFLPPPARPEG